MTNDFSLSFDDAGVTHADKRAANVPEIKVTVVRDCFVHEEQAIAAKPEAVAGVFRQITSSAPWFDADKECVVVLVMNRKNRVIGHNLVSLGSATASLVHPREVLRPVLAMAGTAFVLCHNHPSGDPAPSSADLQITRKLRDAAKIMDIEFQDHVVIGDAKHDPIGRGFYSFRDAGML
jgi:DNA repair protein RadC